MVIRRISSTEKEDWSFKCSNCRKLADMEIDFSGDNASRKLEYLCDACGNKLRALLSKELSGPSKNESTDMSLAVQQILEGADVRESLGICRGSSCHEKPFK